MKREQGRGKDQVGNTTRWSQRLILKLVLRLKIGIVVGRRGSTRMERRQKGKAPGAEQDDMPQRSQVCPPPPPSPSSQSHCQDAECQGLN